ncbi:MAG: hypothetical protein U0359_23170 [Byssovorax sp.]
MRNVVIFVAVGGSMLGCVSSAEVVKDRASFDLSCPREQIVAQELGNHMTMGVSGCGKKATYVYTSDGRWLMNSAQSPAAGTAAPLPEQPK